MPHDHSAYDLPRLIYPFKMIYTHKRCCSGFCFSRPLVFGAMCFFYVRACLYSCICF